MYIFTNFPNPARTLTFNMLRKRSIFLFSMTFSGLIYIGYLFTYTQEHHTIHLLPKYEHAIFAHTITRVQEEKKKRIKEVCNDIRESMNETIYPKQRWYRRFLVDEERQFIYCWIPKVSVFVLCLQV